jgi:anaerobic selenocysteine-containing dehydrogenase
LPPAAEQDLLQAGVTDALKLLAITGPVGSHWLAHLSSPLAATQPKPYVVLHPEKAEKLGLTDGDRARLTTHFGHCHVVIRTDEKMVNGLILAPQLWDTALEGMVPGSMPDCQLEKEGKA